MGASKDGREERVQKRVINTEEAQEAASILMDLSDSFTSANTHKSHYSEAGTTTDLSFFTLEEERGISLAMTIKSGSIPVYLTTRY